MNLNQFENIEPKEVLAYVKQQGWKYVGELPSRMALYKNDSFKSRQLQVPSISDFDDYSEILEKLAEKLSTLERRTPEQVVADWKGATSDTIRLRMKTVGDDKVSFSRALQTLQATKQALIASACSALTPMPHHIRLQRSEATELFESCKLAQTEKGSFILKITCPIDAVDRVLRSSDNLPVPFARKTLSIFMKSLHEVKTLAVNDDANAALPTILSSNFCKALRDILVDEIEVNAKWALTLEQKETDFPNTVTLTPDLVSKIEKLEARLRPALHSQTQTIFGTVEALEGQLGQDSKRFGDVLIRFLLDEEIVYARLTLDSVNYEIADRAHMSGNTIRVVGLLNSGVRNRRIENVTEFKILD
jgi:hypothetical protein